MDGLWFLEEFEGKKEIYFLLGVVLGISFVIVIYKLNF